MGALSASTARRAALTRRPARSASRTSAASSASDAGVAHREGVARWTPDQVRNVLVAGTRQSLPLARNHATASRIVSSIGRYIAPSSSTDFRFE